MQTKAGLFPATGLRGHFLTSAWDWLDRDRILFSVQASQDRQGRAEYSESGGARGELAMLDLRTDAFTLVAQAEDRVFLRPLARWGPRGLLVGEGQRDGRYLRRYWVYDTETWSRREVPIPGGTGMVVADTTRAFVFAIGPDGTETTISLWRAESPAADPLAVVHGGHPRIAWSPDARRIAVATTFDGPVPGGRPDDVQTRYMAWLIEPRPDTLPHEAP